MNKELKGTPLSTEDFQNNRVCTTTSDPNAHYAWDTGIAIGRFLKELKAGKIFGTHCQKCKRTVVPPRVFCELCMSSNIEWKELKDTGRINTFSLCYVDWDAKVVKEPYLPAVIEIDGASAGIGILHVLDEVAPKAIKIGMKVQAVWKEPIERKGDITDIKYWRPL